MASARGWNQDEAEEDGETSKGSQKEVVSNDQIQINEEKKGIMSKLGNGLKCMYRFISLGILSKTWNFIKMSMWICNALGPRTSKL